MTDQILEEAQSYVTDIAIDSIQLLNLNSEAKWNIWCEHCAPQIEADADKFAGFATLLTDQS